MVKQTAGRDQLGGFAPKFAELNDDVLFGEIWSREGALSLKMRSILTISALVSKGMIDSSFQFHLTSAKKNGVTRDEMAEILTHLAFYAGWPNAWAAFRAAVEVYQGDSGGDGGLSPIEGRGCVENRPHCGGRPQRIPQSRAHAPVRMAQGPQRQRGVVERIYTVRQGIHEQGVHLHTGH